MPERSDGPAAATAMMVTEVAFFRAMLAANRGENRMENRAQPYRTLILVCTNLKEGGKACCGGRGRGSAVLADTLKAAVAERGLKGIVRVSRTGCLGQCEFGPNIMVFPEGKWYSAVTEADLDAIIARHIPAESAGQAGEP